MKNNIPKILGCNKAVFRGKFMAINIYIVKGVICQFNILYTLKNQKMRSNLTPKLETVNCEDWSRDKTK